MYIKAVKLRTNTAETRVTCTSEMNVSKICRHCRKQPESIMHIIQFCEKSRDTHYLRHHRICDIVAENLQSHAHAVFQEKNYLCKDTHRNLKPDIIYMNGTIATILDIIVVYETYAAAFMESYDKKIAKYQAMVNVVKQGNASLLVNIYHWTIGTRGSFFKSHLTIWRTQGFSEIGLKNHLTSRWSIPWKLSRQSEKIVPGWQRETTRHTLLGA